MKSYKLELKWTAVFVLMAITLHLIKWRGFNSERIASQQAVNTNILTPAVHLHVRH